ncbi:hypothetical protein [Micromonospora sp. AMSO31t]|uniref:hypothetical protein n=1 Tax=Micromonospora sp. AMSO31t TaxID=2650566 RepID=UPI00124BC590|nr:hypothetical protein [Micromonospora sp. AMSO31t]KAB1915585.1 hypothetical protein F8274_02945 [Micromonospora sp. AMSO31t]
MHRTVERRSVAVLAGWYALAVLVPIVMATLILGPEFLGLGPEQPGPARLCTRKTLACWGPGPDVRDLLQVWVPPLLVGLAMSLLVHRFLVRRFESAVVTGTLSAFSGWLGCAVLACGLLAMLYS